MKKSLLAATAATIAISTLSITAIAGGGAKGHGHGDGHAMPKQEGHGGHGAGGHSMHSIIGEKGDPADSRRSIVVTMTDNKYSPKSIRVSKGETVRFQVKNNGEFVHEFNIGTAEMHKAHQSQMLSMMERGALEPDRIVHAKMGEMNHDDPNAVLLDPGQTGEVIWKFGAAGEIQFACNVPGHYEDGMVGRLNVR